MTFKYAMSVTAAALALVTAGCESPKPAPSRPSDVSSAGSVDYRQREIEARIEQAARAGRITPDEQRMLKSQADDIRRDERRYMADGDLSVSEKAALNARLDSLSRDLDRRSEARR